MASSRPPALKIDHESQEGSDSGVVFVGDLEKPKAKNAGDVLVQVAKRQGNVRIDVQNTLSIPVIILPQSDTRDAVFHFSQGLPKNDGGEKFSSVRHQLLRPPSDADDFMEGEILIDDPDAASFLNDKDVTAGDIEAYIDKMLRADDAPGKLSSIGKNPGRRRSRRKI